MGDIAIQVRGISKQYSIGLYQRHDTLRDHISHGLRSVFHRKNGSRQEQGTFWALKDISFDVAEGEVVGIVGGNGAGKSTLLKILSRITSPTEGAANIYGRVGSLLEVGTGFHPELTGRENIFLNGAILGMRKAEIQRKFDEIVAFSEIEKFIDTPVKRYSSGMYVRLAFAVAAHLEPEILIVDEVLAVGDVAFQKKCLGTMDSVAKQGRTILFVSHNLAAVRSLCSRAFLLVNGQIQMAGTAEEVVQQYVRILEPDQRSLLGQRRDRSGDGTVRATAFEARVPDQCSGGSPRTGAPVDFIIEYDVQQDVVRQLYAQIYVADSSGNAVFACSTAMLNADFASVSGKGRLICHIDYLPLKPGRYWVSTKLGKYAGHSRYQKADEVQNAASFEVLDNGDSGFIDYANAPVVVPHQWELSPSNPQPAAFATSKL
jgi:lipopolysaccharide transport system ATP-binding protein